MLADEKRFWDKVDTSSPCGCWMWRGTKSSSGYGAFRIGSRTDGTRRRVSAHRHAYELKNGPIPHGLYVLHSCDEPFCVNPAHLRIGTQKDNMADRCDRHPDSWAKTPKKLTEAKVLEIARSSGLQREIAARYGISQVMVGKIKGGRSWGHVTRQEPSWS